MAEARVPGQRLLRSDETPGACEFFPFWAGDRCSGFPSPQTSWGPIWSAVRASGLMGVLAPWDLLVCCWGRGCDHPEAGPLFRYLRSRGLCDLGLNRAFRGCS